MSLNAEGFRRNEEYIRHLLANHQPDFLCVQETWLSNSHFSYLCQFCDDYSYACFSKSGVDDSSSIIQGHIPGGVAILFKKSIQHCVEAVNIESNRACCVILKRNNVSSLIVNLYLPVDLHSQSVVHDDLEKTLYEVEGLMHSCVLDDVLLCGDLNTDFSRSNLQTKTLLELVQRNDLRIAWHSQNALCDDTYVNVNLNHKSCIDHFLLSERMFQAIDSLLVRPDPLNVSSHSSIELRLSDQLSYLHEAAAPTPRARPNWAKADCSQKERYATMLAGHLNAIPPDSDLLSCVDKHCSNAAHRDAIDRLCDEIIQCCLSAERFCIPQKGSQGAKAIPGWSTHVKVQRETSLFWHNLWVEGGRALTGPVYDVMKHTRKAYHYAIRFCQRNEVAMRKQKLADCCRSDQREFWNQIKRIHSAPNRTPTVVDDVTGADNIAQLFGRKYISLYHSVPSPPDELDALRQRIADEMNRHADEAFCVDTDDVARAIKRLKAGKGDGSRGFYSDHLLNGGNTLHSFLMILLNCMFTHGHSPPVLLSSVMISLAKNVRASLSNSSNYRSIALCSSLCKLVDLIIIDKCRVQLKTCYMQFGFKASHSTVLCTAVLKETVQHFVNNDSCVYACLLDASKAFDRVQYSKLFNLLLDRHLPLIVTRLLLDLYTRQTACACWNGKQSQPFSLLNGVKQGGVLSPILFTVYMDSLLLKLKTSRIGCHVNGTYVGALCYADDLTLLCPSLVGLNKMIRICTEYADEYNLTFNASKTVAMSFGKTNSVPGGFISLDEQPVEWSNEAKHLGNVITSCMNDNVDCNYKRSCFIGAVNKLTANFDHMDLLVKRKLFNTYCSSFYGSQMWRLNCSGLQQVCTAWQIGVRRLLGLNPRAHRWTLGPLLNVLHIRAQLELRALIFIWKMMRCENEAASSVFQAAYRDARSDLGHNVAVLREKYGIYLFDELHVCKLKIRNGHALSDEHIAMIGVVLELMQCRQHCEYIDLSLFEIDALINSILCS